MHRVVHPRILHARAHATPIKLTHLRVHTRTLMLLRVAPHNNAHTHAHLLPLVLVTGTGATGGGTYSSWPGGSTVHRRALLLPLPPLEADTAARVADRGATAETRSGTLLVPASMPDTPAGSCREAIAACGGNAKGWGWKVLPGVVAGGSRGSVRPPAAPMVPAAGVTAVGVVSSVLMRWAQDLQSSASKV